MIFLSREATYIPKCNGNRDLPDAEQVKFDVRAMTGEEEEKLSSVITTARDGALQKIIIEPKAVPLFESQVSKVYGVYRDKNIAITDPTEFAKCPGTYEYITETVAFIRSGLTETEVKN